MLEKDYNEIVVYYNEEEKREEVKEAKKASLRRRRVFVKMAAGLTGIAVAFGSLGVGIGVGQNYSGNRQNEPETVQSLSAQPVKSITGSSEDAINVIKQTSDSIVSINVKSEGTQRYGMWVIPYQNQSAGSGVIFYEDPERIYILTNNHVIENSDELTISVDDENIVKANLIGRNPDSDLAIIYADKANMEEAGITKYSVAKFGDSDSLQVGETVIAIGNAFGEGKSATKGIISALNKQIFTSSRDAALNVLQTDAAINPGNSGGALVNLKGEVIGINTAKLAETGVEGMGYSIPSNLAQEIAETIMDSSQNPTSYLGIAGQDIDEEMKSYYNLPSTGIYIMEVLESSSAAEKIMPKDLIVAFNGIQLTSTEQLSKLIESTNVGDEIKITVYRNGGLEDITITMKGKPVSTKY